MRALLDRSNRFMNLPLDVAPRILLVAAAVVLAAGVYLFPLWSMTMFAPQYQDGLRLQIHSYKLEGGNNGQDVREINVLNHYIGMRDLVTEDFTEFKWLPFVAGALALLMLRAAVHGRMTALVDVLVLFFYFSAFSLWSFGYRMWAYGHNLDPTASVKVDPFMPPLFGYKQLANFEVYSYPAAGSYMMAAAALLAAAATFVAWRQSRRSDSGEAVGARR
jgi:hypothetical protein